ncbi:MAG: ABC transporter permease [Oscillospiraceae bacterium]|jgi:spermidine/putrescine transport system permease protein
MNRGLKRSSRIYYAIVFTFLYIPIFVLIFFSFNQSKSRNVFTGFTLKWYKELFSDEMILSALGITLLVAFVSSIIATVIGTMASVGIMSMKKAPRKIVMDITYIPNINPEIVTGVSMLLLFTVIRTLLGSIGVNFEIGLGTLIIAHVTFNLPYIIISVNPKLRQLDPNLVEAAMDLGCTRTQAFFKVVVPEIMPGILTGFLMAVTYSVDDFVISYFTSGTVQNLSIAVYAMTRRKVSPEINALSTLIFVIVLSVLLIRNIVEIKKEKSVQRQYAREIRT